MLGGRSESYADRSARVPPGVPRDGEVMSGAMSFDDDPLAPPEEDPDSRPEASGDTEPEEREDEPAEREDEPAEREDEPAERDEESPERDDPSAATSGEGARKKRSDSHVLHEGEFTAPSVGPHTTFDKRPPEERLDFDRISDVDAMGEEKRRQVVGGTYGPTRARVAATFATFFAVVAVIAIGFWLLAQELDQPPDENPALAPWSEADAPQRPPRDLQ